MSDDNLNNEISLSAELTETGVKAGATSRALASFDRLVGAIADIGSAHLEGYAERRRARTRGDVVLIDSIVEYGVEHLGASPDQAKRAFEKHFKKVLAQQENIEAVVGEAETDLLEGAQNYEDIDGQMSEAFFDRFETYSASANTQELRHRWGRVLAAEIRRPGTFSQKVLRVIDELEPETAQLFERVCQFRVGPALYKPLMKKMSFPDTVSLVSAGLLVEPGVSGQHTVFSTFSKADGKELLIGGGENLLFAFSRDSLSSEAPREYIAKNEGQMGVPVLVLTDAGRAIATILPDSSESIVRQFASVLAQYIEGQKLMLLRPDGDRGLVACGYATPTAD